MRAGDAAVFVERPLHLYAAKHGDAGLAPRGLDEELIEEPTLDAEGGAGRLRTRVRVAGEGESDALDGDAERAHRRREPQLVERRQRRRHQPFAARPVAGKARAI